MTIMAQRDLGTFGTEEENGSGQRAVSVETGNVSPTPGQRILLTAGLYITGEGILFEVGEKYS